MVHIHELKYQQYEEFLTVLVPHCGAACGSSSAEGSEMHGNHSTLKC